MSAYASYGTLPLGVYAVGDTLTVQFTGKNIPNIGLFTSERDIQPVGAGGTGLFLQSSSNTTGAGSYTFSLVGPRLQDPGKALYESWNTGREYQDELGKNYELACDSSYANSGYEGSYFGLFNMQNDATYRYTVSTAQTGSDDSVRVNATLVKWNGYEWVSVKTLAWEIEHGLASLAGRYAIIYGLASDTGIDEIEFYYYLDHTETTATVEEYMLHAYPGDLTMTTEGNRLVYTQMGLNALLLGSTPSYSLYSVSETSNKDLYTILSDSSQRVIMMDNFLERLSAQTGDLTDGVARTIYDNGDHKETVSFTSQEEINAYVAGRMANYKDFPAFYGLRLKDEPSLEQMTAVGQVYKAIKACMPDCFVLVNLLPVYGASFTEDSFREYLNAFLDASGADYLMTDSYPIRTSASEQTAHARGLQIMAEICAEKNLALHIVTQTYTTASWRAIVAADMEWQINLALAFGVDCISYYRYSDYDAEDSAIFDADGNAMEIYDCLAKKHAEIQRFAPVLLDFSYAKANVFGNTASAHIASLSTAALTDISAVSVSNSAVSVLVTEMVDENGNRGYMIVNAVSTAQIGANAGNLSALETTVELTFASGVSGYKKIVGDTLFPARGTSFTLGAGEAAFIIVE